MRIDIVYGGEGIRWAPELTVVIDRERRGRLRAGDRLSLELPDGPHTVRVESSSSSSDTYVLNAQPTASGDSRVLLESGLSFEGESDSETLKNRLFRGAAIYVRAREGGRRTVAEETRRLGFGRAAVRYAYVDNALLELKVFVALAIPTAIVVAIWLLLR